MEPVNVQRILTLRNAPKGLSSKFHPIRSKIKGTLKEKTAKGRGPPASQTDPVGSITASLAPL